MIDRDSGSKDFVLQRVVKTRTSACTLCFVKACNGWQRVGKPYLQLVKACRASASVGCFCKTL